MNRRPSYPVFLLWLVWSLILAAGTNAFAQQSGPSGTAQPVPVVNIVLHDTLQPLSAEALRNDLQQANAQHPAVILLDLSTPGGMPESAEAMATMIRTSATPVVIFPRQPGTQVAGEGLRLLVAGRAAVMHPETRLLPLTSLRRRLPFRRAGREAERAALADALASALQARGRHAETLRELLRANSGIAPKEALYAGLVDAVVTREDEVLRVFAGNNSQQAAALADAHVVNLPMTPRQHLMRALMNPDLTVFLLTLGALLIFLEINTPGTILPGAAGVLLVLLSVYALLQMPLRWQGVLLLMLSVLLLLAETQFARGSAYGVGAVVALTLGLRLLVRGPIPELEVNWGTSIGAGLGFGGITAGLVLLGVRARRAKVRTGADAMLGWLAIAQTPLHPTGEVLVRGELWRAHLSAGNTFLAAGECVKVQGTDGTTLEVAPMTLNLQEADTVA